MAKILTNREYKSIVNAYRRLQARCVKILGDAESRDYDYLDEGYDLSIFFDKRSNRVCANVPNWQDTTVTFLPMELNNGSDGAKAWSERYADEKKDRERKAKARAAASARSFKKIIAKQEREAYEKLKAKYEKKA